MTYSIPREKIKEFSDLAMAAIETFSLLPTPQNFELWFVYYSEGEPEIKRTIDKVLDDQPIDDEKCLEIHSKYLGISEKSEMVQSAGSQIQQTIRELTEAVSLANQWTEDYNESLSTTQKGLKKEKTLEEINKMLSRVLEETTTMLQRNSHMNTLLERSTSVMEDMQRDLEVAQKEAVTDSLTGLANRKSFDIEIAHLANKIKEGEYSTFSLLMMDVDHFKSFNDKYGHLVGDQVLKLTAKTLNEGVKGRDIACRYGGEEFAILLPETALQDAMRVAEHLREEIASKDIVNRASGEKIARITISVGAAEYNIGEKIDDLILRSDEALYKAKDQGRNKVVAMSYGAKLKRKA